MGIIKIIFLVIVILAFFIWAGPKLDHIFGWEQGTGAAALFGLTLIGGLIVVFIGNPLYFIVAAIVISYIMVWGSIMEYLDTHYGVPNAVTIVVAIVVTYILLWLYGRSK